MDAGKLDSKITIKRLVKSSLGSSFWIKTEINHESLGPESPGQPGIRTSGTGAPLLFFKSKWDSFQEPFQAEAK